MAEVDIELITNIEGLEELEEALTDGSRRAVRKYLRQAEMKAAKVLVESAEDSAPVDTGDLAGDIHRMSVSSDGALTVRVGPGSKTFYGMFQEFGAPEANVPARHWLENSARAVQDQVLEELMAGLQKGLEDMKR